MRNLSEIVDNKDIVTKDYIPTKTSDLVNDSNFMSGMTILSYGNSTWQDFLTAYQAKHVVYCRASSNSNPASDSQTRLAFMAYVSNAENPTNVEFQYYRSVSSHTASQQGDQVYVYKLDKTAGWTVTTREASVKIDINSNNEGIETTYSNGVVSIGHANSVTAQTTQAVYPIAYDAQGHITSGGAAASVPTQASDIGAIASSEKGAARGVVPLDSNSLIDEQYLPSYVDDVIEGYYYEGSFYEDSAHTTTITGETGKIYIDLTGSKSYRWSGTVFVEITSGGHTYTAGNGIDISAGDVISVDTDDVQEKLVSGTNIKTINNTSLLGNGNLSIEGVPHVDLTQAQYDALTPAEKNNGTIYFITDGSSGGGEVTDVEVDGVSVVSSGIASIDLTGKQNTLVSGTNIKTINNNSLLGSGNISITSGLQNMVDGSAIGSVRGINTAEESSSYTIGQNAFAEGLLTKASGIVAHAEGDSTEATGNASHAEGVFSRAIGHYSHAEGVYTTAIKDFSHAEGYYSETGGAYAHAQNNHTVAGGKSQTSIGEYNLLDQGATDYTRGNYAFIIGNGTSDNNRSNALTVNWTGDVDIASGAHYKINGTNLSASDVGAQATLVSGTNIKTINNTSILGSGNIAFPTVDQTYDSTSSNAQSGVAVASAIAALPEPMIFKGSLGTGGTITSLPTASSSNEGFVYKVITDGTYASQSAKIGDTFISDGSSWVLIPSGDEPSGTVTSVGVSNATNGGLSVSGSPITSSGTISIGHSNVLTSAQSTSAVYPITIDKNGHIASYGSAVSIPTQASDIGAQPTLVSGTNIKTINNESILGSGNITISSGTTYTAGTGIDITNNVISIDLPSAEETGF